MDSLRAAWGFVALLDGKITSWGKGSRNYRLNVGQPEPPTWPSDNTKAICVRGKELMECERDTYCREPVCASTTDVQAMCGRPNFDGCLSGPGYGGTDEDDTCRMDAVPQWTYTEYEVVSATTEKCSDIAGLEEITSKSECYDVATKSLGISDFMVSGGYCALNAQMQLDAGNIKALSEYQCSFAHLGCSYKPGSGGTKDVVQYEDWTNSIVKTDVRKVCKKKISATRDAYAKCTAITTIVDSKVGGWGFLGLIDGKITSHGFQDERNYKLQTNYGWTGKWSICKQRQADGTISPVACENNKYCEKGPTKRWCGLRDNPEACAQLCKDSLQLTCAARRITCPLPTTLFAAARARRSPTQPSCTSS